MTATSPNDGLSSLFEAVSAHLLRSADGILARWRREVAHDPSQPANRLGLDETAIDDHLPSLLALLARCLRGEPTQQVEKEGAAHGHQRRALGYTVDELLWEMALFRRVLLDTVDDFVGSRLGADARSVRRQPFATPCSASSTRASALR